MKKIILTLFILSLSGCVQYSLVPAKTTTGGGIQITPSIAWNKAPSQYNPGKNTEVWTADGQSLNQLVFVGGVSTGSPIFKQPNKNIPMPAFSSDMLPNEIEEMVETSIKNRYNGQVAVDTSNLRPAKFGDNRGFRFNVEYFTVNGLQTKGDVIASIKDDQLYMIIFTAAGMHYYDKYIGEVEKLFASAAF
ncbi:hypothetical protein FKG94_16385 [Exilibacterium tricleocarpae]|uniref:PsbP C-terminal domain-containing protein n=1 Tax=Exilibacterium tricleocarpae TaxID=2591008 RepID=A0A545TAG8_9GAMM|nr:hypothetical protein [Exilibacterium tricleocarpae]TQV74184.1 hypothetical protein FKG94_16385 [Exilibacterium tricleocarpae]